MPCGFYTRRQVLPFTQLPPFKSLLDRRLLQLYRDLNVIRLAASATNAFHDCLITGVENGESRQTDLVAFNSSAENVEGGHPYPECAFMGEFNVVCRSGVGYRSRLTFCPCTHRAATRIVVNILVYDVALLRLSPSHETHLLCVQGETKAYNPRYG